MRTEIRCGAPAALIKSACVLDLAVISSYSRTVLDLGSVSAVSLAEDSGWAPGLSIIASFGKQGNNRARTGAGRACGVTNPAATLQSMDKE